ncbi:MAG: molybdopterin-dependent oxidoreductase [Anaerolineae bacterium]
MKLITRRHFVHWVTAVVGMVVAACAPRLAGGIGPNGETRLQNENNPPSKPKWNVRYYKPFNPVDNATWRLKVEGLVENPGEFSLQEIQAWPSVSQVSRMVCVEGWSCKAKWLGFNYQTLAEIVKPKSEAKWLGFECADAYYEFFAIEEMSQARVLFVHGMDGEQLPDLFGAPLRLICPFKYGYKGPKAITTIRFEERGGKGYWSTVGPYSSDGTVQAGVDRPVDLGDMRTIQDGEVTEY